MFNSFNHEPYQFVSNPPLSDYPSIVPDVSTGNVRNKLAMVPRTNHSPFEGVDYSHETMSLRSKLNLGIPLSLVSIGQIENDPNVLAKEAISMESQISQKLIDLDSSLVVTDSEPSK